MTNPSYQDELMRAILAMDAYNRGEGAGFKVEGEKIGNYTLVTDNRPITAPEKVKELAAGFAALG